MYENLTAKMEFFVYKETAKIWNIPSRINGNHEFVFVIEGSCIYTLDNKEYHLVEGDINLNYNSKKRPTH